MHPPNSTQHTINTPQRRPRSRLRRTQHSSSSRKSNGINPSGYGGTICIDFSRSSTCKAEKEKDRLMTIGRIFFFREMRSLMQTIGDWVFTVNWLQGGDRVSSQFSKMPTTGVAPVCSRGGSRFQCWRDWQCAFHPPWERTSDNPPLKVGLDGLCG